MKSRFTKTILVVGPVLLLIIIGGFLWQAGLLSQPNKPFSGPLEKVTVGIDYSGYNALLWIAQDRGFDRAHGLELNLKTFQTGKEAIANLSAGGLVFACCTEFVLVQEILAGNNDLACLSVLSSGDNNEVIARRDRGISRVEDLRGKIIGVPRTTSAEFSLGRFLTLNQIDPSEVTIVDIKPLNLAEALATGKVDAVQIWEPIIYDVVKEIGPQAAITWPAQGGQDLYWLLLSRKELIKKNPAVIERLLLALMQAADFIKQQPKEAQVIVARWLKVPISRVQSGKFPKRYELFLDQALILAMEDEARWMIRQKLNGRKQVPDFLDYLDPEALLKADPKAVRLVLPGKGNPG
jgi:NitT/TauT family transport system substrate-binding protein